MQDDKNQFPPKRSSEHYHSVLVEIGLIPSNTNDETVLPSASSSSSSSTSHNTRSLALLNHLLQTQQLSPETLKTAHSHLFPSSFSASSEDPVPNTLTTAAEEPSTDNDQSSTTPALSSSTTAPPSSSSLSSSLHFYRHIALHLYYDGAQYSGLAETIGRDTDQSIEKEVFAALRKACLLQEERNNNHNHKNNNNNHHNNSISRELCQYSRCGRTDRGVSAAGQVLALKLKSAFRSDMKLVAATIASTLAEAATHGEQPCGGGLVATTTTTTTDLTEDLLPLNGSDTLTVECPSRHGKKKKKNKRPQEEGASAADSSSQTTTTIRTMTELPYDKILNNLLPDDIRILGWCPVSKEFSARFSAKSRTYRYFFVVRPTLDLEAIRTALSLLVGTHDFRNFCKMDVEQVYNFTRTIYRANLVIPTPHSKYGYFEIHGQAFLWHQIRCIAHVLFLVGHGLESPHLVTELLNVKQYPGKPSYPLASELPLVLHDCAYDHLRMGYSTQNLWSVACLLEQQCEHAVLAAARIRNCLERLHETAHVRVLDLTKFAHDKWQLRKRKQQQRRITTAALQAPSGGTVDSLTHPFEDAEFVPWSSALAWMETLQLVPEPMATVHDATYIPILQRSKGPTYEEKVANLQQSAKRRQRYETNVIKKRKTPEEDQAFYERMTRQGGASDA